MPNIALIQELRARRPKELQLLYIGSRGRGAGHRGGRHLKGGPRGMEEGMMKELGVPFKGVLTGKVRRYFSLWNLVDAVKLPLGIVQAAVALLRFRPKAVFATGGFVSFPVAFAAWILRIPVVLYESDVSPGLANRLCAWFARKICVSYEESRAHFPARKVVVTGSLVRREIREGRAKRGRDFSGLKGSKPVILVMGGSQGAHFLNQLVWDHLDEILENYQVAHICGKGKMRDLRREDYRAFEFVGDELKDLYALAAAVVTRSGAVTLAELSAAGKPAILVPLSKKASRGDQILNARAYAKKHAAYVMEEETFELERFWTNVQDLASGKSVKPAASPSFAADTIIALLEQL